MQIDPLPGTLYLNDQRQRKKRNPEMAREKCLITYNGTLVKQRADFLSEKKK